MHRMRGAVLRSEHHPNRVPEVWCVFPGARDDDASALSASTASAPARSAPQGRADLAEPDTLIEELDEDDADVSELVGEKDAKKEDT